MNLFEITKKSSRRIFLLTQIFFISSFATLNAQNLICRLERIAGFDTEYIKAKSFVGSTTSHVNNIEVFITKNEGQYYIHSNFITPGAENPTKITTNEDFSLEDIMLNLISADGYIDDLSYITNKKTTFYIDGEFVEGVNIGGISLARADKINIVDATNKTIYNTRKIRSSAGEYFILSHNNTIYFKFRKDFNLIANALNGRSIDRNDCSLINFVMDNATKKTVTEKFNDLLIDFDPSSKNLDDLKNLMLAKKDKKFFLLGHIEGDEFVTLNSGNKVVFKESIQAIQEFATENNIQIFFLGCNSAKKGVNNGALDIFRSIDVLNNLEAAFNSSNVEDFLQKLSNDKYAFLIDEKFFNKSSDGSIRSIGIAVYEKDDFGSSMPPTIPPIGRVVINFPNSNYNEYDNSAPPLVSEISMEVDSTFTPDSDQTDVKDEKEERSTLGLFFLFGITVTGLTILLLIKRKK